MEGSGPDVPAYARRRGLEPCYEHYIHSDVYVEPDPEALALLTPEGRLAEAAGP